MRKIFITVILCIGSILFGQVGMSTPNPRGALDINKDITHNMGLILPANSDTNNIINPMGGKVIPGTIIYDSTKDCMRFYKKTDQWSNCIRFSTTAITAKNKKTSTQLINLERK